ncbi:MULTISPECIES: hypothetical protein [unclassified Rhizobium]|uniref:hypothetical protein n=1 Tax=unclassified Rhizobium TaxID=2613769 RepID=UPI001ADBE187|nr:MULTISPECIES: hypothetical protein [unclassified Rhizobium]MBO9102372.1 hypothetical protein [Rhizobium sp. L58/93]MBO9172424.1 hypothetical protein [Rhizobium sp. L245/93]QXZ88243.1 hypothetical protein J5287_30340 [Rhizobium sp. K1/93]QXZ94214.1 hypothetical protein J5280_31150 [Rhizobium sp. K15/93]QYA05688.1 hypothetical protein J5278_30735 [Rhizobium sp. B21/90]
MAKVFELKRRRPVIVFLPEGRSAVVVSTLVSNRFQVSEVWSIPELFDAVRSGRCAAVVTLDTSMALVLAIGSIKAIDANAYFGISNAKSTFDAVGFLKRITVLVDADGRQNTPVDDGTLKSRLGRISDRPLGRLWSALILGGPQPRDPS